MSESLQVSIVRHTHNYEAMLAFYHESLGMQILEAWDHPGNRGTLLTFGGRAAHVVVEVIELGNEAVPGGKPVNLVLSVEVDDVKQWHDQLLTRGIKIARGLEDAEWGHRSFGIDDPDGLRLWYYQDLKKNILVEHQTPAKS